MHEIMVTDEETTPIDPGPATDGTKVVTAEDDDDAYNDFLSLLRTPDEQNSEKGCDILRSMPSTDQTDNKMESSEENDIESPATPTNTDAPTSANDASSDPRRTPEKMVSAPEPPRWRFVGEAKKSMGYSSHHAGSYIKGKSSNELGAKYAAPDVSLYSPKEENDQPMKNEPELPTNEDLTNEDIEVGKMAASVPSPNACSTQDNKVGKLQIIEASPSETQALTGEFAGLPKSDIEPKTESHKPLKEWETTPHLGPKPEQEEDTIHDSNTMPDSEEVSSETDKDVGKLKIHGSGSDEEAIVVEITNTNGDVDDGEDHEYEDSDGDVRDGNGSKNHENAKDVDGSTALTEQANVVAEKKRRFLCLFSLLLLALVVIFLGVVLGKKNKEETTAVSAIVVPPTDECGIDLRVYSSSSNCLAGFSSQDAQLYSIVADGECHDSGKDDLGYYIANCDTSSFQLSRSGCTDETCSDCSEVNAFSGKYQEGGCMVDWSVSDLDKSGSVPFSAVADGECHDSGIDGLGHYVATCHDDGDWFQLLQSSCTDESCSDCTGTLHNLTFVNEGSHQCNVDAFYREQVWSISGSCQRPQCSGSVVQSGGQAS